MPNEGIGQEKGIVHIVDDDSAVRQSLAFLLETAGHAVRLHESARHFLVHLDGVGPTDAAARAPRKPAGRGAGGEAADTGLGCVVTDVRMPEIDGLELLRRLKARGSLLPVVVMTGHADVALAVQAMKEGAVDFIEKPFDDQRFLDAIDACFARIPADAKADAVVRAGLESLSERERQVLEGVLAGKPNKVIAYDLKLSPRTIEVYRANMMAKMRADSLADLVRKTLSVRGG